MTVMMQTFDWDAPMKENKLGQWWNHAAQTVSELAASGLSTLWLPPISKCTSPTSNGCDPYDYFDLGDFDQKRSVKTAYGNRAELEDLIATLRRHKMSALADMVLGHNSGADRQQVNPLDKQRRWTRFVPKSGKFPRDWNSFHPCRYERYMVEGKKYADFPHLCHRNPRVYEAMFDYARQCIDELDFDGFRFDFVKGYGAWIIGLLAKYQYQKKDDQKKNGCEFTPFVVGQYWSGPEDIGGWLDAARAVTDRQIAAFDTPLRYKLKDVSDTPNYDLRNLTDEGSVAAGWPFHAVTFVENHDMRPSEIANAKLLGYSFILTPRRLSLHLLAGLLHLPTGAPRPGQWHRRADHCASSSYWRRVLCPSRGLRPLHHAARRHRAAEWPCLSNEYSR